jgi:hypothetical protein
MNATNEIVIALFPFLSQPHSNSLFHRESVTGIMEMLPLPEYKRYGRQMILDGFGLDG